MNTTQTKAGHTPGPWTVQGIEIKAPAPANVQPILARCIAANAADRALIAAAPELLEALKNAANVLAALATGDLNGIDRNSPALTIARAAIEKATK